MIWPDQIIYQPNVVGVFGEDVQLEVSDFDGLVTNIENSPNKNTAEQQKRYVWKKVQSDQKDIFGLHFQGQTRLGCPNLNKSDMLWLAALLSEQSRPKSTMLQVQLVME